MLLVFPVSHVDIAIALPLAKWMRELGPYPNHSALIIWSHELTPKQKEPIATEFRAMGWSEPPKAFTVIVSEQAWPTAPNEIFRQTAMLIENDPQLRKVWYFFEPDNTPMRKGWLDDLREAYNADLSKPFLGYIDTTWEQNTVTGDLLKIGNHMVGTGIYPPFLSQFTGEHITCGNAFDLAMSRDIVPHARHTSLIHNNWQSGNYRREKGIIVSDVVKLRAQQFGFAINKPVPPEAAVVHGCKDGSLLRLIQKPIIPPFAQLLDEWVKESEVAPIPLKPFREEKKPKRTLTAQQKRAIGKAQRLRWHKHRQALKDAAMQASQQ